jgi:hypothetical protein
MWDTFALIENCPQYVNYHPMGENSPNLVTLKKSVEFAF